MPTKIFFSKVEGQDNSVFDLSLWRNKNRPHFNGLTFFHYWLFSSVRVPLLALFWYRSDIKTYVFVPSLFGSGYIDIMAFNKTKTSSLPSFLGILFEHITFLGHFYFILNIKWLFLNIWHVLHCQSVL